MVDNGDCSIMVRDHNLQIPPRDYLAVGTLRWSAMFGPNQYLILTENIFVTTAVSSCII